MTVSHGPNCEKRGRGDAARLQASPRCGARTRTGSTCASPAIRARARCRMHGGAAGSGAPRGNRNALKDGFHTAEARSRRRALNAFIRDMTAAVARLEREVGGGDAAATVGPHHNCHPGTGAGMAMCGSARAGGMQSRSRRRPPPLFPRSCTGGPWRTSVRWKNGPRHGGGGTAVFGGRGVKRSTRYRRRFGCMGLNCAYVTAWHCCMPIALSVIPDLFRDPVFGALISPGDWIPARGPG